MPRLHTDSKTQNIFRSTFLGNCRQWCAYALLNERKVTVSTDAELNCMYRKVSYLQERCALSVGMNMAEKNQLYLYVSVFQYVMKMSRFSAYRCSVHAAARLRKVRRKRPGNARLRKVERASVRSELGYGDSGAYVWKSHLRKVRRKGRKNARLRKVGGGRRGRVGQDRV